jgi:hypothetical protein
MTPRYEWTPASEPPDSSRLVQVRARFTNGAEYDVHAVYDLKWGWPKAFRVTHWRDVKPPEGKGE